jgi:hypothetical protein
MSSQLLLYTEDKNENNGTNNSASGRTAASFYPTPESLLWKITTGIELSKMNAILEPSAGKGDIVKFILKKNESDYNRRHKETDIDCIEIDENLQSILKGKSYRVVHNDFLTFHTFKKYDLIIMNPPFAEGDKHLLKAIELQSRHGGQIICILNAETLRNCHTNTRKDLSRKLADLEAEIEFTTKAFCFAERKTDVEIAVIKIDIPEPERVSDIMNNLKADETDYTINQNTEQITHSDYCERMVAQCTFEIRSGLKLIQEYAAMAPHILDSTKKEHAGAILQLKINDRDYEYHEIGNAYVEKVRYKYWEALFKSEEFMNLLTSNLRDEYCSKLKKLRKIDFSIYNIEQIKREIMINMVGSLESTILQMFDKFSQQHHYNEEYSKNIHYYNGWKTNKAWYINKKVILPCYRFYGGQGAWGYSGFEPDNYDLVAQLMDIEKVLNYLDQGRTDGTCWSIRSSMEQAKQECQTVKIPTKYFHITFYKKGTMHITFKDDELLKKFNIFGSQRKGWLPPAYGKATYSEMNQEERAVVDDFEGKEKYQETLLRKDFYITESKDLLKLTSGDGR